jgi:hypothetical protein
MTSAERFIRDSRREREHKYDPDTDRCVCGGEIVWAHAREMCERLADDVQGKSDPRLAAFPKPKPRPPQYPLYD